uniref:Uncharacterized protein LOC104219763 n=1 Tax=Nicotiana sylvestris TaxID=4096 RepID=A0A1U7W3E7_NICSY|nr:PREDICTED: uncharacterized protein LOC104219763 [Nicotiana sylvestris]
MSHGCYCSKVFSTERSDVEVLIDTTKSALNNANSKEVWVFDEGSHVNGNTHQSHSKTLQIEYTIETLVNQIGIPSISVPINSLVGLTGFNGNVTKVLESKNKEEENARDNAAPIPFTRQGYVMLNAIGRFHGIEFSFATANQNILFHHHDFGLHKYSWIDTGTTRAKFPLLFSLLFFIGYDIFQRGSIPPPKLTKIFRSPNCRFPIRQKVVIHTDTCRIHALEDLRSYSNWKNICSIELQLKLQRNAYDGKSESASRMDIRVSSSGNNTNHQVLCIFYIFIC